MKHSWWWILVLYCIPVGLGMQFSACEDRIELELKNVPAQLVIVGEISNRQKAHLVTVQRTLPLSSKLTTDPVSGATVRLIDPSGRAIFFNEGVAPGEYYSRVFRGVIGGTYQLEVTVEGTVYSAQSTMPEIVLLDSIGTASSTFLGKEDLYVTLKFNDPKGEANYYRYLTSLNGGPLLFSAIFNDRFNDGLHVTHELMNFERDLKPGDYLKIQRQYIDEATYLYWRSIAGANPGVAAPTNPPGNFSGGALGYFSAFSYNDYDLIVPKGNEEESQGSRAVNLPEKM